ncbi:hypothetical protein ACJX0J_035765, partial [Zea mays]
PTGHFVSELVAFMWLPINLVINFGLLSLAFHFESPLHLIYWTASEPNVLPFSCDSITGHLHHRWEDLLQNNIRGTCTANYYPKLVGTIHLSSLPILEQMSTDTPTLWLDLGLEIFYNMYNLLFTHQLRFSVLSH